ncbi:MAG: hypothetical protein MK106_10955 [Mariniblastus sp.]|nr:hypothetical protein [Mariniblastus sp.]
MELNPEVTTATTTVAAGESGQANRQLYPPVMLTHWQASAFRISYTGNNNQTAKLPFAKNP